MVDEIDAALINSTAEVTKTLVSNFNKTSALISDIGDDIAQFSHRFAE